MRFSRHVHFSSPLITFHRRPSLALLALLALSPILLRSGRAATRLELSLAGLVEEVEVVEVEEVVVEVVEVAMVIWW